MLSWPKFMSIGEALFLFAAATAGGALNSVAGGGGFIVFPALLFTGMPPINANATNTAALWPGTAASVAAYRNQISEHKKLLVPLMMTGIVGGLTGAWVLLRTPQSTFMMLVPWLLLFATLLLTFNRPVTRWLGTHTPRNGEKASVKVVLGTAAAQLFVGLYIGYFGGGAGMLMMALFAILGVQSIHAINGLKTALATITNGMALLTFVIAGTIWWPQASLMIIGGALGGYGGAWLAQRIDHRYVRRFAIGVGFTMTAYFFAKVYLLG